MHLLGIRRQFFLNFSHQASIKQNNKDQTLFFKVLYFQIQ